LKKNKKSNIKTFKIVILFFIQQQVLEQQDASLLNDHLLSLYKTESKSIDEVDSLQDKKQF
jgi:hypothetical protein